VTAAGAVPAGTAVLQGGGPGLLPSVLRHQRHAHPAGAAGGPYPSGYQGGERRVDNGLLLRSDVHTLFDRGYLGVDQEHRLLVSPRLRADFSNGDQFYAKAGQLIDLPERRTDRPGREFLEWHLDEVFLKAAT
jgi:HNH endonuclease